MDPCALKPHLYSSEDKLDYTYDPNPDTTYTYCEHQPCPHRYNSVDTTAAWKQVPAGNTDWKRIDRSQEAIIRESAPAPQTPPADTQVPIPVETPGPPPAGPSIQVTPETPARPATPAPPPAPAAEFTQFLQGILASQHNTPHNTPHTASIPLPGSPVMATTPSLQDILNLFQQTATQITNLTDQVDRLATQVTTLTAARSNEIPKKINTVEKPVPFKGKSSEDARIFRHAFLVWVRAHRESFHLYDANGKALTQPDATNPAVQVNRFDEIKMITSALSMMQDSAAIWARPYVEQMGTPSTAPSFKGDWAQFVAAFQAKFEPINASQEAKNKLMVLQQGKRTFASLISEFETWAPRTGWSDPDLFDRLKTCMLQEYLRRMSYYPDVAKDYKTVKKCGHSIDLQLSDLLNNTGGAPSSSSYHTSNAPVPSAFRTRDPNAMDIDATNFDSFFEGLSENNDIYAQWKKAMRGRCNVCGSKAHKAADGRHGDNNLCGHCGKTGHWRKVCLARLQGKPKAHNASATDPSASPSSSSTSIASSSSDSGAEIASLKDQLEAQRKELEAMTAKINASF